MRALVPSIVTSLMCLTTTAVAGEGDRLPGAGVVGITPTVVQDEDAWSAPATPKHGRRRGLDLEAYGGVVGAPCSVDCTTVSVGLGRMAGGSLLYRALPHLAFGVAGEAHVFPFTVGGEARQVDVYTALVGPTIRGYFVGDGPVDGYVGLAVGACFKGDQTTFACRVGIEHVLGADIRLGSRLRLTPSVAFATLVATGTMSGSDDGPTPLPPLVEFPWLSASFRLGVTVDLVK